MHAVKKLLLLPLCLILILLCACGRLPSEPKPVIPDKITDDAAQPPAMSDSEEEEPAETPDDEQPAAQSVVQALAAETISDLDIATLADEAKIRAIYRHMIGSIVFADPVGLDIWRYLCPDGAENTPIPYMENRSLSPLLLGIGSCEDFAAAAVLLLQAAGFEAEYVAGYTLSVDQAYIDHAWAVVRMDGAWYHLDPQLEQNVVRSDSLRYRYYLKTDEEMLRDHKWGENLIEMWPELTTEEQALIRSTYIVPECQSAFEQLPPEHITLPPRPDTAAIKEKLDRIRQESGRDALPPIPLNIEPPILSAKHHITPPLDISL